VFWGTLLPAAVSINFATGMCSYIGQLVHEHESWQSCSLLHTHNQGHGAFFLCSSLSSFLGWGKLYLLPPYSVICIE
jgi:hypothetical protein